MDSIPSIVVPYDDETQSEQEARAAVAEARARLLKEDIVTEEIELPGAIEIRVIGLILSDDMLRELQREQDDAHG